ncbi:MAG: aminotransferase class I/II-fold pyridoxal phosphate-dependent enzyme, partial [Planctomycetes bacterium]|nr:aminotransferase class I/II-fold pyridoxal phosphate-dependent enzyme [Planctomycetota bacterium]
MRRTLIAGPDGADFVTNDIFRASKAPEVVRAAQEVAAQSGVGSGASRLLGGDAEVVRQAETQAAEWLNAPATLLFPSGFQANLGLLSTLARPGDTILSDELNHASLIDGARLSGARISVYRHLDLADLEARLRGSAGSRRRIVVTESLFSMDGDLAPLQRIAELCRQHQASLVVDEAHAIGLLGPRGAGAWASLHAGPELDEVLAARIITGGKSLGVAGAFVVGSRALCDTLINRARSFVFTTGIALPLAGALTASIQWVAGLKREREHILSGAQFLARALGLPEPAGAIVPVPCGSEATALAAAEALRSKNISVHAVRPPTVPPGTSRLRLVVHADHTADQLETIVDTLRAFQPEAPERPPAAAGRAWVVIGTDTDVGKTVVSSLILHGLSS